MKRGRRSLADRRSMKTSPETEKMVWNDETLKAYETLECFSCRKTRECCLMREKETDRLVVAKVFYPEDELFECRQPEEIRKISFPGVPAFIEEIRDEKKRIEIREFIPGRTLDRAASEKEPTAKEILDITLKLCDILQYLHDRPAPVIHRDVKPQNVVINEEGEVFLIDFDIARIAKEEDSGEEPSTDTVVFGTQMFAAPEQYGFSRTDARSDIYSLGVLIRWLLDRVTNEDQRETKEYRLLSAVAKKCSELDPGRRYQSISKVKDVLLHKKEKRAFLGLSAAVLFGIVLAAVLLFGKKTEAVTFEEPVLEEAIRLQLGKTNGEEIREEDLLKVENIFAACDRMFLTEEEYYEAVSVLDAAGANEKGKLSKLTDAAKCSNLKKLCIAYEAVTDISVLSGNTKLEKLELKKDNVKSIDVVRDLPELRSVGLCGDPVTDISPLRELEHLLYLDLCGVDGYEPSALSGLPHLEYLDINNRTVSFRHLKGNSIKRLRLGYVNTNDFSFLLGIRDLERVEADFQNAGAIRMLGDVSFAVEYYSQGQAVQAQTGTEVPTAETEQPGPISQGADSGRMPAAEYELYIGENQETCQSNFIYREPVTVTGDNGQVAFDNCIFYADVINAAETGTRVIILENCEFRNGAKCVFRNNVKEATIDTSFPKLFGYRPIEVVCEDCSGISLAMGTWDIVFNGETYKLEDSQMFIDNLHPETGAVPYTGQEANIHAVCQWFEKGKKIIYLDAEYVDFGE